MKLFSFSRAAVASQTMTANNSDQLPQEESKSSISTLAAIAGGLTAAVILTAAPEAQALVTAGDSCTAVREIQTELRTEGYNVAIDGIYGSNTRNAVISYQSAQGLSPDGIVGSSTATSLGLSADIECGYESGSSVGDFAGTAEVTAPALNVRNTPNGSVIDVVNQGATLDLTGEYLNSGGYEWAQIANGGWVATNFLDYQSSGGGGGEPSECPSSGEVALINASPGVNARSGPGLGFDIVGSYANGAEVCLSGIQDYGQSGLLWSETTDGRWIAEEYLN